MQWQFNPSAPDVVWGGDITCLAPQVMKMVLLTLLARFEIAFVGTADGREPAERLMFAMAPVGLQMRLTLRAGTAASLQG